MPKQSSSTHATKTDDSDKLHKLYQFRVQNSLLLSWPESENVINSPKNIDKRAEDFIYQFKRDLMLQRLQSIENHKKMMARGL